MLQILLYSLLVMLASLIGVVFVWRSMGRFIEKNLRYLVSFSAGVFLVVSFGLTRETAEHAGSVWTGILWIAVGIVGIWLIFKFFPLFHHHHDKKEENEHHHSRLDARRIMFGDGIHNIGDGILLAATFSVSSALGTITALSIFIHEIVQEVSEFFVLRQAGFSIKKALILNFLVSTTILVGSIGGYFLLETFKTFEVVLLGISAGSFLVVVLHDLIPHSVRTSHTKAHYLKHVMWFVIGLVLMWGLSSLTSH